jgi:hypothetical protein
MVNKRAAAQELQHPAPISAQLPIASYHAPESFVEKNRLKHDVFD